MRGQVLVVPAHFLEQEAFFDPASAQEAFLVQGHLSHLFSAFLSAALHSVASHFCSDFFCPLAGHWAVAVATTITVAAANIIIFFIFCTFPVSGVL